MSYFVYKIKAGPAMVKELELQNAFDKFKEAKTYARELREALESEDTTTIKVIYADNQLHAEELLMEHREPRLLDGNEDPI
jgi:hypothetical protein